MYFYIEDKSGDVAKSECIANPGPPAHSSAHTGSQRSQKEGFGKRLKREKPSTRI
jgi:hypothetical protein